MPRTPAIRNARAARVGLAVLLALMVMAQTLGWMHRSLHGHAGASRPTVQAGATAATASAATTAALATHVHAGRTAGTGQTWLHGLFGDHADATDCRLFDLIAQPGCMPATALAVASLPPTNAFLAAGHAGFVARWSALFDARGPPPAH